MWLLVALVFLTVTGVCHCCNSRRQKRKEDSHELIRRYVGANKGEEVPRNSMDIQDARSAIM